MPSQRKATTRRALWAVGVIALVAALGSAFAVRVSRDRASAKTAAQATTEIAGPMCEPGISAAKHLQARASTSDTPALNTSPVPTPAPQGMVWIPGGEFWMGSNEATFGDARPWHKVYVDGFWMDKTEVTNEEFAHFVKATGYVTVAERKPLAKDYPGAPPENLVAGSVVFAPPGRPVALDNHYQWWGYAKGANWRHPEGPKSDLKGREKHPVVHIAYEDAVAYCKWAGNRLPTEAEFEFAERGGLDRKRFAWGDEFKPGGKFMANTFQGHFPDKGTGEDGFVATAPVASFPANGYGLYDTAGNVWEWTSDWYRPDYYQTLVAAGGVARNPKGPRDSFDPSEPGVQKKVHRGGSYLCTDQYCARYAPGGRGKGDLITGTNHLGFRCVQEALPTRSK